MRIRVFPETLSDTPSSPLIFGNFIESGFGRQVPGLWAEKLFNPSFENVPPLKDHVWGWLGRQPGDDLTREDWWHSGYEENAWYVPPGNPLASYGHRRHWDFHHGLQAAFLVNPSTDLPASLAQDGIFLCEGETLLFKGYMRTGELSATGGPVTAATVGLYREGNLSRPIAERLIHGVASDWREFSADLRPVGFKGRATFAVSIPPGSDIVLDGFSLMPSDCVHGWRRDAVEALTRVRPAIIRFPGGCFASFYRWRDGIGPRSERMPRESEYWGGLEDNAVGTAEFCVLCRLVGAQPFLCVNVMTGTPEEAADWVAYCNAPTSHPLGALRAAHGFAEPFGVNYWELDNEAYRKYGPIAYAHRCVEFANAMKAADTNIRLVMVGYWRFRDFLPAMLDIAGRHVDLVADRGLDEGYLRGVLHDIRQYNRTTGRHLRLCNTEWLAPDGDAPGIPDALNRSPGEPEMTLQNRQIRWRYAMSAARQLLTFQRLGGDFEFANFNNLANTWGQNVIECSKSAVWLSAAGRVFELLSRSPGAWPLRARSDDAPGVVAQAAWNRERTALVVDVLNCRTTPEEVEIDLGALGLRPAGAELSALNAPSLAAHNSEAAPDTIRREVRCLDWRGESAFRLAVNPLSVNHVVLTKASARAAP